MKKSGGSEGKWFDSDATRADRVTRVHTTETQLARPGATPAVSDDQKRTVREGYDDIAAAYDAQRSMDPEDVAPLPDLRNAVGADCDLLDLGCGAGKGPLEAFPEANGVGLDFSRAQVELGRSRLAADFVLGDMAALPFADDTFDAVTAFFSIIHVPIDEHRAVFEEVRRVLRPGGQFVFCTSDDWTGGEDDWLEAGARMEWSFPSLDETEATLDAVGLEIVERYGIWSEMDQVNWPFYRCRLPPTA